MSGYLADVGALARKDLLLELRARDTLPAMLLFVVAIFVVFHFALPSGASELAASGLLWVAIVFTALDADGAALLDAQLRELAGERTLLVSTHDPARIEPLATLRLELAA